CLRCMHHSDSLRRLLLFQPRTSSWEFCQRNTASRTLAFPQITSPRILTHRPRPVRRLLSLSASSLPRSRATGSGYSCACVSAHWRKGKRINMKLGNLARHGKFMIAVLFVVSLMSIGPARAQGPAPETAPTLFPGGALVSYNSVFTTRGPIPDVTGGIPPTSRPTYSHDGIFNFTWGFYRNLDVNLVVPIVTNDFKMTGTSAEPTVGGTGLGDIMLLVKYRFFRRDSKRGTTQASVTIGPKFPSGATSLTDTRGNRLPASLQPGSGSTDLFLAGNFTYTGLFGL